MKKEVEAVKQYRQLIGKGIFRTALQKDIYGSAYKGLGNIHLKLPIGDTMILLKK